MSVDKTTSYIVAGHKSWNRRHFDELCSGYAGQWHFIQDRNELNRKFVEGVNPRYIFFLHWSYIVPADIHENWECVCFHMTDVPYGRGGSPLQNLILRGHETTKLTALKMSSNLDAGPVYMKRPLSLGGAAEEIYMRASQLSCEMIKDIAESNPNPMEQQGEPLEFVRRKADESEIPTGLSPEQLHDFIRMLDAEGYPNAYVDCGGYRLKFTRSALGREGVRADVQFVRLEDGEGL